MRPEDELIERIVDNYLGAVTGAREAFLNDAQYHAEINFMRNLLQVFSLAMRQELLQGRTRLRVLERVMMAAPDPAEALKRIEVIKNTRLSADWPDKTCRW